MAVLESDLRALSAEARRRYPAVKDGAEHAILKVLLLPLLHFLVSIKMFLYVYFLYACSTTESMIYAELD